MQGQSNMAVIKERYNLTFTDLPVIIKTEVPEECSSTMPGIENAMNDLSIFQSENLNLNLTVASIDENLVHIQIDDLHIYQSAEDFIDNSSLEVNDIRIHHSEYNEDTYKIDLANQRVEGESIQLSLRLRFVWEELKELIKEVVAEEAFRVASSLREISRDEFNALYEEAFDTFFEDFKENCSDFSIFIEINTH